MQNREKRIRSLFTIMMLILALSAIFSFMYASHLEQELSLLEKKIKILEKKKKDSLKDKLDKIIEGMEHEKMENSGLTRPFPCIYLYDTIPEGENNE